MRARCFIVYVACFAGVGAASSVALADEPSPGVHERRAGLVLGGSVGMAAAGASGYPKEARFYGNPDYYSSSPLLVGHAQTLFLMGALGDSFSFGPVFSIASFASPDWRSTGWGAGVRAEAFPFMIGSPSQVTALRDLAVYGHAGVGTTELQRKGPYPSAEVTQSYLAIGAHYEWRLGKFLGGHGSAGPYVEYASIFGRSAERHVATVGLRLAFYGGRVGLDQP